MRQSRAALPQLITPEKTAVAIKLCLVLYTKYIPMAHKPAENVLKTLIKYILITWNRFGGEKKNVKNDEKNLKKIFFPRDPFLKRQECYLVWQPRRL